jgi:hypothetical protein
MSSGIPDKFGARQLSLQIQFLRAFKPLQTCLEIVGRNFEIALARVVGWKTAAGFKTRRLSPTVFAVPAENAVGQVCS